jgi:hypothetical protein
VEDLAAATKATGSIADRCFPSLKLNLMKKIAAVSLICVMVPLTATAQGFSLFPPQTAANKPIAPATELQPFPANSSVQNGIPTLLTPANDNPNLQQKNHPHLIELSAANWRPLTHSEKFELFWRDMLHWETHASIAFDSGLSFATRDRPYLGNGARGYFTRYGLNAADEANFCFFTAFFFPSIFHQDPRYIPRDGGRITTRLAYSLSRVIVTRNDSGKAGINGSGLLGMFIATSTSSVMYSNYGADVGVGGNFAAFALNEATTATFNVFKEFWPDAARKMKLGRWLRNIVRASIRDTVRVG